MTRAQPSERLHSALADSAADILAYLERRVVVREDAADLLGETMLVAWRRVKNLPEEREGARMWLFGIARTTLLNYRRGRRRHLAVADALRVMLATGGESTAAESGIDVRRAIDSLPAELAEIVRLVHWDGFALAEAAGLLGIPAPTARGRYARARALLSSALPAYDASVS